MYVQIEDPIKTVTLLTELKVHKHYCDRPLRSPAIDELLEDLIQQMTVEQPTKATLKEVKMVPAEESEFKMSIVPDGQWRGIRDYPGYWMDRDAVIHFIDPESTFQDAEPIKVELMPSGRRAQPSVILYRDGQPVHLDVTFLFKKTFPELA